ncbi:hypothetical protein M0R45_036381 [Rubus argutus]|uniref:Uncharacterized protein n=1 Tax=Rubus argutus TaxID=59490 RepID=A0AAW1VVY0_RUBAR
MQLTLIISSFCFIYYWLSSPKSLLKTPYTCKDDCGHHGPAIKFPFSLKGTLPDPHCGVKGDQHIGCIQSPALVALAIKFIGFLLSKTLSPCPCCRDKDV